MYGIDAARKTISPDTKDLRPYIEKEVPYREIQN